MGSTLLRCTVFHPKYLPIFQEKIAQKSYKSKSRENYQNTYDIFFFLSVKSNIYIYEDFGEWCSGDINGGLGVGLWKEIKKEWPQLFQNTYFVLGNGRRISFWKDVWCGEEALSLTFPNLFRMTAQKDARVADLWNWDSGEGGWNPIFLRSFND